MRRRAVCSFSGPGLGLVFLLLAVGCQTRKYEVGLIPPEARDGAVVPHPGSDAGTTDASAAADADPAADGESTGPDLGVGTDACSVDFERDPANCGMCGHVCTFEHAAPLCEQGQCKRGDCLPGFIDLDGKMENGCEYGCIKTNDGKEICDERDNDCNGVVDDGTDKQTDLANCGFCGYQCTFFHAAASCEAGKCKLGACEQGFTNANALEQDGCECQQTNSGKEICDGLDNDCNGMVDDVPAADFQNDPQHCGACNRNCSALPYAVGACQTGGCVLVACAFGHRDVDRVADNGCEVACPPGGFEGGTEVCDGIDNDCDGKVDGDDDSLVKVANFCATRGECAGTMPRCTGGQWLCEYPATVQTTTPGQVIGNETWCDGKDNDCDGCVDESFPQVGRQPAATGGSCDPLPAAACLDQGKGACQGKGTYVCDPNDKMAVTCKVTTPGATPAAEVCDGLDNNCDGIVDNGDKADPARVKEPMVAVSGGGLAGTVYVYSYEASRPDATAASPGRSVARACARPGVMPWTNVSYPEAVSACQAAGKRLCTEAEWQRACETAAASACTWSFGSACTTASQATCNTYEYDGDSKTAGDQDVALPTGGLSACYAAWGADKIFDLTGNAKEWTKARAAGKNPVRGGAYDSVLDGATCSFNFAVFDDKFRYANTGFRCCADAP